MADKIVSLLHKLSRPHPVHGIASPGAPHEVKAFIECAPNDQVKFEIDKETGYLFCDRPHKFSSLCPVLYGFVPRTHCGAQCAAACMTATSRTGIEGDGDPLDICVLSTRALQRSDLVVNVVPIGGFRMIDGGQADDKIIAVIKGDAVMTSWKDISDIPESLLKLLKHFFLTYKLDPARPNDVVVDIPQTYGREEAHRVIQACQADYLTQYGNLEEQFKSAIEDAITAAAAARANPTAN
jgi:inorganic pyrophosphatase